ncbi:hypothetical protein KA977_02130 [Candidatus Dependentiae bacterium]|nr:hypothetical protein [Candidatus Dependentiae bacterium]
MNIKSILFSLIIIIVLFKITAAAESSYSGVIYSTDIDKPDTKTQLIDLRDKSMDFKTEQNGLKLQKTKSDDLSVETKETPVKSELSGSNQVIKNDADIQINDKIEKSKSTVEFKPEKKKKSKLIWYILGGIAVIAAISA